MCYHLPDSARFHDQIIFICIVHAIVESARPLERTANPATINIYKSIQNYTYLHCDVPRKTSSCFIVSDFAAPKNRLLSFDITLCRLKFPSSDRYTFRFPCMWKLLNFFAIYISTIGKLQCLVLAIVRPFLPTLFSMC